MHLNEVTIYVRWKQKLNRVWCWHYVLILIFCGVLSVFVKIARLTTDHSDSISWPRSNSASEMTYIVSGGALNSTHSPRSNLFHLLPSSALRFQKADATTTDDVTVLL